MVPMRMGPDNEFQVVRRHTQIIHDAQSLFTRRKCSAVHESKLPARLDQDQVAAGVIVGHAQKMQFDVRGGPYALNILIRLP